MFVKPHKIKSREVTKADMGRVLDEVMRMYRMFVANKNCVALAHPQVDDKDPLRFFVTKDGKIFVNPIIERHSNYTVDSEEGCMTFPDKVAVTKKRWHKCVVSFQPFNDDGELLERTRIDLSGLPSHIAQHEIDHLDGVYCYDNELPI